MNDDSTISEGTFIFKVVSVELSVPYAQKKIALQPVGDMLVAIEGVPIEKVSVDGILDLEGTSQKSNRIIGTIGLKYVLKQLEGALYIDIDSEDF